MKHLLLACALLLAADLTLRHGKGLNALVAGMAGVGHAVGAWVFYTGT